MGSRIQGRRPVSRSGELGDLRIDFFALISVKVHVVGGPGLVTDQVVAAWYECDRGLVNRAASRRVYREAINEAANGKIELGQSHSGPVLGGFQAYIDFLMC